MSSWTPPPRGRQVVFGSLIVVLVFLAYFPAVRGGFVWDDDLYITDNPLLTARDGLWRIWFSAHTQSQYFPLVYTTFRIEHQLWGLHAVGYHLVNICFQALNALLVWRLLRRLEVPGAWFAAAIFALHPVQVESVAWITELKNLESYFFYLLAAMAWLHFIEHVGARRWLWYGLALVTAGLALFAKTTACTLPAALLLLSWLRGKPLDWRLGAQLVPFLAAGMAMGSISIWWEGHLGNRGTEVVQSLDFLQRTLLAGRALWFYVGKLLWPANLCFSYPRWTIEPNDPLQYLGLAGAVAAAVLFWRKRFVWPRGALAGPAFFVAALSPLIGFIPNYTWLFSYVADHYQYPATIGLIALFAAAVNSRWIAGAWNLPARVVAGSLLLFLLGSLTWRQARIYTDPGTLWTDTIAKNPGSWLAHNNLGNYLSSQEKYTEAAGQFREAIRLNPHYAKSMNNLGIALAHLGDLAGAAHEYREALKLDPALFGIWMNLGNVSEQLGQLEDAADSYRHAADLEPTQKEPLQRLFGVYGELKNPSAAVEVCRRVLKSEPDDPQWHYRLAGCLEAQGNHPEAAAEFQESLRLQSRHAGL